MKAAKRFLGYLLAAALLLSGIPVPGGRTVNAADGKAGASIGEDSFCIYLPEVQDSENYDAETGAYTLTEEEKAALNGIEYQIGDAVMISVLFKKTANNGTLQEIFGIHGEKEDGTAADINVTQKSGRFVGLLATDASIMRFNDSSLNSEQDKWYKLSILVPYIEKSAEGSSKWSYYFNDKSRAWTGAYDSHTSFTSYMSGESNLTTFYFGHAVNGVQVDDNGTAVALTGEVGYISIKKIPAEKYAVESEWQKYHNEASAGIAARKQYLEEKRQALEEYDQNDYTAGSWRAVEAALLQVENCPDWEVETQIAEDPVAAAIANLKSANVLQQNHYWDDELESGTLGTQEDSDVWHYQIKEDGAWKDLPSEELKGTTDGEEKNAGWMVSPLTADAGTHNYAKIWRDELTAGNVQSAYAYKVSAKAYILPQVAAPDPEVEKDKDEINSGKNGGQAHIVVSYVPSAASAEDGEALIDLQKTGQITTEEFNSQNTRIIKVEPGDLIRYAVTEGWVTDFRPVIVSKTAKEYAQQWLEETGDSVYQKCEGNDYTDASKNKYKELYQNLQTLLKSDEASGAQIDEALETLQAQISELETTREIRFGVDDNLLPLGEQSFKEEDEEIYSHIKNLAIDITYKIDTLPTGNIGLVTLTGAESAFLTIFESPDNGRVGFSAGLTEEQAALPGYFSGKTPKDEAGKWQKLTFNFISRTDGGLTFSVIRNGQTVQNPFSFNATESNISALKTLCTEIMAHKNLTGLLVGQVTSNCGDPNADGHNGGGAVQNMPEGTNVKYVRIRSSYNDVLVENQAIDKKVKDEYDALLDECHTLVDKDYTEASWNAFKTVLDANSKTDENNWTESDWAMLDAIDAIKAAKAELVEAAEKEAHVAYATGSDNTMGTLNVEVTEKEASGQKQATFTATPADYYKFAGWYKDLAGEEKADETRYTESPYTCDIPDDPASLTLYGKFAVDTDAIDKLIEQVETKQAEPTYEDTYSDASKQALAAALAAAKAADGKTPENAKALKNALDSLTAKGDEPWTEVVYSGGNDDGTLKLGQQELPEKAKAFYDGVSDFWIDMLYKYDGDAVPDKNIALFTISDGGTETEKEQYVTFWHNPSTGAISYSSAYIANGVVSNTTPSILWTTSASATAGKWHKLSLGIDSETKQLFVAQDGVIPSNGTIALTNYWTQIGAFFAEHAWQTGKVQIGEKAVNGTYVTLDKGGDIVNFNDASVNGALKYVKIKSSGDDVVAENQLIDEDIENAYDELLTQCSALKAVDYTKASWDAFQTALAANSAPAEEGGTATWTKSDWAMQTGIDEIGAAKKALREYKAVASTSLSIGTEFNSREAGDIFDGTDPDKADGSYIQVKVNEGGEAVDPADMEITWGVKDGSTGITVNAIANYPSKATLSVEPGAKGTIQATVTTKNGDGTEDKTMTAECNVTVGYEVKADHVTGSTADMGSTQIAAKDSTGKEVEAGKLLLPGDTVTLTPQPADFYLFKGWYKDAAGTDPYDANAVTSYTYTIKEADPEAEDGVITFYAKFELDKENIVPISSITLTPAKESLTAVGETTQIAAVITPDNASMKTLDWSSSDDTIATVDQNGLVTAVASGEVTITAAAKDGSGVTGTCKITVSISEKDPDIDVPDPYPFTDIDPDFWKADREKLDAALKFVNDNKYMTGYSTVYPDGVHFGPGDELRRYQFALIVYRMAGSPQLSADVKNKFNDVTTQTVPSEEARTAIRWAHENGVITGYNAITFGPNDKITRAQMMTMMYRFAEKVKELKMEDSDYSDLSQFGNEVNDIQTEEMKKAVSWCVGKGIVNGVTENGTLKLLPQGTSVRAQCAIVITGFGKIFDEAE